MKLKIGNFVILITLGKCTKSQKSGQNHENPAVIRSFFPKCLDLSGRLHSDKCLLVKMSLLFGVLFSACNCLSKEVPIRAVAAFQICPEPITSNAACETIFSITRHQRKGICTINYPSVCEFSTHICYLNIFYCGMSICPCDLLPQNVALATQKELYSIYGRIHHTTVVPSHSIMITVYERACGTW